MPCPLSLPEGVVLGDQIGFDAGLLHQLGHLARRRLGRGTSESSEDLPPSVGPRNVEALGLRRKSMDFAFLPSTATENALKAGPVCF